MYRYKITVINRKTEEETIILEKRTLYLSIALDAYYKAMKNYPNDRVKLNIISR